MARVRRVITDLSERRACKVLSHARSTQRFKGIKADTDKPLVAKMHELAGKHPRYGYRRIHAMLEQEGFKCGGAGRDRVHRLWRLHGLRVPRKVHKRRRLGTIDGGITRHAATHKDHVWTYDFVKDQTTDGRPLKILTVVDEFTRECLAMEVARPHELGRHWSPENPRSAKKSCSSLQGSRVRTPADERPRDMSQLSHMCDSAPR